MYSNFKKQRGNYTPIQILRLSFYHPTPKNMYATKTINLRRREDVKVLCFNRHFNNRMGKFVIGNEWLNMSEKIILSLLENVLG